MVASGAKHNAGGRPIIVTAGLPLDLFAFADKLRKAHFPTERNWVPAHLTLFHAMPPSVEAELRNLLSDLCARTSPIAGNLTGVRSLGWGTALEIDSPGLLSLRGRIAERFAGSLTAQDDHCPRFHITVQNKVESREARKLQVQLSQSIQPRRFVVPGLEMHYYDGGPWEFAGQWRFRGKGKRG